MPIFYTKNGSIIPISYYDSISCLQLPGVSQTNRVNVQIGGTTKYIGLVPTSNQYASDLRVQIGASTCALATISQTNDITVSSDYTFSLNGNVAQVNNLTINGNSTVNVRSSASGGVQWSILEVLGNLTVDSGSTLNLIRVPLIVRGNILGAGTITSPDGVDGGAGGIGGPGGGGGGGTCGGPIMFCLSTLEPWPLIFYPGVTPGGGQPGSGAPGSWPGSSGCPGSSMQVEYNVSSGAGGSGSQGTAGGGGGSYDYYGGSSGNGYPGGYAYYHGGNSSPSAGAGGGGAGGPGSNPDTINNCFGEPCYRAFGGAGGSGATGSIGSPGNAAGALSTNYIGIGTPSPAECGISGTYGGSGGPGYCNSVNYSGSGYNTPPWEGCMCPSYPGCTGGCGGRGGGGAGTGGAHISMYVVGTIASTITVRTGRGGRTGGSDLKTKGTSGSLWTFSPYTSSPVPFTVNVAGRTPAPNGPAGTHYICATTPPVVTPFLNDIGYSTKTKTVLTYP